MIININLCLIIDKSINSEPKKKSLQIFEGFHNSLEEEDCEHNYGSDDEESDQETNIKTKALTGKQGTNTQEKPLDFNF
jgi:hypothetical protein